MTTDITELAQSLKAAAENAIGAHESAIAAIRQRRCGWRMLESLHIEHDGVNFRVGEDTIATERRHECVWPGGKRIPDNVTQLVAIRDAGFHIDKRRADPRKTLDGGVCRSLMACDAIALLWIGKQPASGFNARLGLRPGRQ